MAWGWFWSAWGGAAVLWRWVALVVAVPVATARQDFGDFLFAVEWVRVMIAGAAENPACPWFVL